jgi:hypothetical protein
MRVYSLLDSFLKQRSITTTITMMASEMKSTWSHFAFSLFLRWKGISSWLRNLYRVREWCHHWAHWVELWAFQKTISGKRVEWGWQNFYTRGFYGICWKQVHRSISFSVDTIQFYYSLSLSHKLLCITASNTPCRFDSIAEEDDKIDHTYKA